MTIIYSVVEVKFPIYKIIPNTRGVYGAAVPLNDLLDHASDISSFELKYPLADPVASQAVNFQLNIDR